MATYSDLYNLYVDSPLLNRTSVAVCVKAQAFLDDNAATAAQIAWAVEALKSPRAKAEELLKYVLAKNQAASVAQIQAASDSTLQGQVDTAIDAIIAGGA